MLQTLQTIKPYMDFVLAILLCIFLIRGIKNLK
jgi:hypothetical protein